ncbi:MAG: hypothetical protein WD333_12120 [Dehalococcoidia bacterium]
MRTPLLLVLLAVLAVMACQREPERFELDIYPADYRSTDHGIAVSIDTMSFRPGYVVREGMLMNERQESRNPVVRVEGTITNETAGPVKIFLSGESARRNATLKVPTGTDAPTDAPARIHVVGAQHVESTTDGQASAHHRLPPNTEFPLLLDASVQEFNGVSDLILLFERVEFSESGTVEQLSYPGIELGEPRHEEFDPFMPAW